MSDTLLIIGQTILAAGIDVLFAGIGVVIVLMAWEEYENTRKDGP